MEPKPKRIVANYRNIALDEVILVILFRFVMLGFDDRLSLNSCG